MPPLQLLPEPLPPRDKSASIPKPRHQTAGLVAPIRQSAPLDCQYALVPRHHEPTMVTTALFVTPLLEVQEGNRRPPWPRPRVHPGHGAQRIKHAVVGGRRVLQGGSCPNMTPSNALVLLFIIAPCPCASSFPLLHPNHLSSIVRRHVHDKGGPRRWIGLVVRC